MHLRTAYLPEAGAPLVCRFESDGREIVVEGMVAWRREDARGGEFGVKFTALDSRCVDALRGLCGDVFVDEKQDRVAEPGARVRLHIDGLGSPMKARVKTGGSAKVQVGSSLEFLKLGRRLEVEDLDLGARKMAEIDGVSITVDPSSQVPQLIVALRFEGREDSTPSPSVAELNGNGEPAKGVRIPASAVSVGSAPSEAAREKSETADSTPEDDADPELRGRVAVMAASAEQKAKAAGEKLAKMSNFAARGAAGWLKSATAKVLERGKRNSEPPRRTTSPAPSSTPAEKPKLRPQSGTAPESEEATPKPTPRRRTLYVGAGASVLAIGAIAFAMRGPSAPPPGVQAGSSGLQEIGAEGVTASAAAKDPGGAASARPAALGAGAPRGAITANVPLFGPTPLATTEPAPLGPAPGLDSAAVEAAEKAAAESSMPQRGVDQRFSEEADDESASGESASKKSSASSKSEKPEDVAPWGHGRMHEPVIHRLRLDAPGAKLVGAVDSTGFTVTIPSRKVMEAAAGIAKRDPRIARVRATNSASGAQVSFQFKNDVPSYRVRLRQDFVEFLISANKDAKDGKSGEHDASKRKLASAEGRSEKK
jgi:hypothetical protein